MKIKPRGLFVLVEPDQKIEKIGSIFIPEDIQDRPNTCTVRAVGAGEYRRKDKKEVYMVKILPELKVGDRVELNGRDLRYGYIPTTVDGKVMWYVDERDVLCIVEEVPNEETKPV